MSSKDTGGNPDPNNQNAQQNQAPQYQGYYPYVPAQYSPNQPQANAAPAAPAPGFVPVAYYPPNYPPNYQPVPPYQAAYYVPQPQNVHDYHRDSRIGTSTHQLIGGILGFMFPIWSLLLLCCFGTLKFKRGLFLGHAICFGLTAVVMLILGISWSASVRPYVCDNLGTCMDDVTQGVREDSWVPYMYPCSNSSYRRHDFKFYRNATCPSIPDDYDRRNTPLGPQTPACAECVCEFKADACKGVQAAEITFWILGFFHAFLCAVFVHFDKRTKARIAAAL